MDMVGSWVCLARRNGRIQANDRNRFLGGHAFGLVDTSAITFRSK
jgi:hypothetical protein